MCYSGECKYENYLGDCIAGNLLFTKDAKCIYENSKLFELEMQDDLRYIIAKTLILEDLNEKLQPFINKQLPTEIYVEIQDKIRDILYKNV